MSAPLPCDILGEDRESDAFVLCTVKADEARREAELRREVRRIRRLSEEGRAPVLRASRE